MFIVAKIETNFAAIGCGAERPAINLPDGIIS